MEKASIVPKRMLDSSFCDEPLDKILRAMLSSIDPPAAGHMPSAHHMILRITASAWRTQAHVPAVVHECEVVIEQKR